MTMVDDPKITATPERPAVVRSEPEVYRRDDVERSFFRDLLDYQVRREDAARDRLTRNNRMQLERRAVDLNTTAGTGGEFAPPWWFVADWVKLARAGRVTADLLKPRPLPPGIASVNLPKVTGGSAAAVQTAQGNAAQDTAATSSSVSSGIMTIAGQQSVSNQLVEQSGIPLDEFILKDLALDYASKLNTQVITATAAAPWTGGGILNVAGISNVTWTDGSPTAMGVGSFYSQLGKALTQHTSARQLPATSIVMNPRRWYWLTCSFDAGSRPATPPLGNASESIADQQALLNEATAVPVGECMGVPVFIDASIPTNLGTGTNQDAVILMREDDLAFFERPIEAMSFDATFAGSLEFLFRVVGFAALLANTQPLSICTITGTGLATPNIT